MIFAPLSWPSNPGFAMTTRIFLAIGWKYMSVQLRVIGSSPAWPNPGSAQSGYLVEGPGKLLLDCGPGVLGRLRESELWPHVEGIAITHWHLDHWGDLVPWVCRDVSGVRHPTHDPRGQVALAAQVQGAVDRRLGKHRHEAHPHVEGALEVGLRHPAELLDQTEDRRRRPRRPASRRAPGPGAR